MLPRRLLLAGVSALALAAGAATTVTSASAAPSATGVDNRNVRVCDAGGPDTAGCYAIRHDGKSGGATPNATPSGYGPAQIQGAYGLSGSAATPPNGPLVAIVDAYDDPTAESDLAVYRSQYGLPACTTTNGCFRKVNQNGQQGNYPRKDGGWAQEISLDLDMVSAACPNCRILLVEAKSNSFANLGTAVNTAANLGAKAISNSYGTSSDVSDSNYGTYYNHPGVAVTASSGDNGYGVGFPASSQYTVGVGGTSLRLTGGAWTESAWSGAGSGCSTYNSKPSWQTSATQCSNKAVADVSAVADPNTGVAVYDSTAYQGMSGWMVFGGTSASSPIIASLYALGGNHGLDYPAQYTWQNASGLNDVTSGSNGSCSTAVWCTAGSGWDGPTGLGTPNGTSAF